MRNIYLVLLIAIINLSFGQSPEGISYQAVVRNTSGELIKDAPIGIKINLLTGSASGTSIYDETHTVTSNSNGLITLTIGQGTSSGDFSSLDWSNGAFFIKTQLDLSGGTTYTLSSTSQLLSVPFALYAKTSGNGISKGSQNGDMLYWNGSSWTTILAGQPGQYLQLGTDNLPFWGAIESPSASTATVITSSTTSITTSSAVLNGEILNDGGSTITSRGFCYGLTPNPTITGTKTNNGTGVGTFTAPLSNLPLGTSYYVRAYAINADGVKYGNQEIFSTQTLEIGASYQGGVVAYILAPEDAGYDPEVPHGLIAAPSDQSAGTSWGCNGIDVATSTDYGTGNANSVAISAACNTAGIAAKICLALNLNGYTDWYLPSKDELDKLYINRDAIGGFQDVTNYWSSSQGTADNRAWVRLFNGGNNQNFNKQFTGAAVRAVRTF